MSEIVGDAQEAVGVPNLEVADRCASCVLQCMLGENFRDSSLKSQSIAEQQSMIASESARLNVFDDNGLPVIETVFDRIVFDATNELGQLENLAFNGAAHSGNQAVIALKSRQLSEGCDGPGEALLLSTGHFIGLACNSRQRAFIPELVVEPVATEVEKQDISDTDNRGYL